VVAALLDGHKSYLIIRCEVRILVITVLETCLLSTADNVLVSPARKPPKVALNSEGKAVVLDARGQPRAAEGGRDDEDDDVSDADLIKPLPGCSAAQIKVGEWLQHKARCPGALLGIFYTVRLRAWIGLMARLCRLFESNFGA
jgi:hypothetical protein